MLVLNIGLIASPRFTSDATPIRIEAVRAALQAVGFFIKSSRVVNADHAHGSEATLVVGVDANNLLSSLTACLFRVSTALQQDCIAVRDAAGYGFLAGPHSTLWGEFNLEYFHDLLPSGVTA